MGKWTEESKKKHSELKTKWWAERKAKKAPVVEVPVPEVPPSEQPDSTVA